MSTVTSDLWPDDIKTQGVAFPEEILQVQADALQKRTGGLLAAEIVQSQTEDRVVLGFEVSAIKSSQRALLFEVQHRIGLPYPAAIIPPEDELPDYLKERHYVPSMGEVMSLATSTMTGLPREGRVVENDWIASTPIEFSEKVKSVLALPQVKSVVVFMLASAK